MELERIARNHDDIGITAVVAEACVRRWQLLCGGKTDDDA